jgi:NAD(P)-dependent dehydrogenase (short-subunit alcohol dehydrogenase family)
MSADSGTDAMLGDTEGKVAIITGGSRGIGAGLVAAYRKLGWRVVASAFGINRSDDPDVLNVDGDLSQPATASRIVTKARERFDHIDTLVNNAGIYLSKPFLEYSGEDYAAVVGVNLTGFFTLTQLVVREMLDRGHGHIVNITATAAEYADSESPSVLAALTKGGVASATKSLAIEYASRGIRVNAVSPGVIQTPLHASDSYDALAKRVPLGRVGQVSDIVRGVMFLEAAPYITGEILHVDGGRSAGH